MVVPQGINLIEQGETTALLEHWQDAGENLTQAAAQKQACNSTTNSSHHRVFMRKVQVAILAMLLLQLYPLNAANAETRVIISSDVRPGMYGRVDIGGAPPPPLVYAEPVVVVRQPPSVQVQPIYLHVPPGHAKHWSKHCHEYNACGVPVYFVKSAEYETKKPKKEKKEKKKDY